MPAILQNLICHYDGIGWIPTIRGCLSLDLIDNAKNILGDVDKYSVKFKTINGLRSAHYLFASSLQTVNDSKAGDDYERTFRYIFSGSINNEKNIQAFLRKNHLSNDEPLKTYIQENGLLMGHLTIIVEYPHKLTTLEVTLLNELKALTKKSDIFQKKFNVEAVSMEELNTIRNQMLRKWKKLKSIARKIEINEERPTYSFNIALTRDGILLLKDVTRNENKEDFAASGTADDYTQNIPLHRLFKTAMNYVKYLFHSNYHHNENHDTYLPSSNLYPAKASGTLNLRQVFRHQLDAFLVPVIKLKRNAFSSYTVEPKGIILYAKAFIRVFEYNKLVPRSMTKNAMGHCDVLQKEIEQMTARQNTIVNTLMTQHNPFVIVSGLLAFVFAFLKTADLLQLKLKDFVNFPFENIPHPIYAVGKLMILAIMGFAIYIIPSSIILKKQFKLKIRSKNILLRNSKLKRARFSYLYELYISYNTIKMQINAYIISIKEGWFYNIYPILLSIVIFICLIIAIGFFKYLLLSMP